MEVSKPPTLIKPGTVNIVFANGFIVCTTYCLTKL